MTARLLVVDDDPANARYLEVALSAEYYEVRTIGDGAETLEVAVEWQPDVILLDVMMKVNGYDVCSALKAHGQTKHIPVVMVTGLREPADRRRGLSCGADEFLTKPIEHEILMARLRGIIRLKRVMDEWRARHATMASLGIWEARDETVAPGRALVIDDVAVRARRIQGLLVDAGVETSVAKGEHDAAAAVEGGIFDLVIVSLSLEGADPLRLLAKFQSSALTRDTPLLMTAEPEQTAMVIAGLNLGASDCVMQPIDDVEFMLRANHLIRRKRHQDGLRDDVSNALALAVIDPLTKLYNRRYLLTHLDRLLADRTTPKFAILMIDVDHFKAINDRHGHAVGDNVLEAVARLLYANLRKSDLISRFGGEEFVTILGSLSDERRALNVAEKIRVAIEGLRVFPELGMSVSIGVAIHEPGMIISAMGLIELADRAMYEAKRRGRNIVAIHDGRSDLGAQVASGAEL